MFARSVSAVRDLAIYLSSKALVPGTRTVNTALIPPLLDVFEGYDVDLHCHPIRCTSTVCPASDDAIAPSDLAEQRGRQTGHGVVMAHFCHAPFTASP